MRKLKDWFWRLHLGDQCQVVGGLTTVCGLIAFVFFTSETYMAGGFPDNGAWRASLGLVAVGVAFCLYGQWLLPPKNENSTKEETP